MSSTGNLASFCRLCLSKNKDRVPVFEDGSMLENLLLLIEIQIDPNEEPGAIVCVDCIVTLEAFQQFKDQCHANDELIKNIYTVKQASPTIEVIDEIPIGEDIEEDELAEHKGLEHNELIEKQSGKNKPLSFADKFQEFAVKTVKKETEPIHSKATAQSKGFASSRLDRKTTPSSRYTDEYVQTQKWRPESEDKEKYDHDVDELDDYIIEEDFKTGPSLDEQLQLANKYPDFFFFEKAPHSKSFTMVYYEERFDSALFTEYYTYWRCCHRQQYECPALVRVTNDYKEFIKQNEHNHSELTVEEMESFTPMEALPSIFEACRKAVLKKRVELNEKHTSIQTKLVDPEDCMEQEGLECDNMHTVTSENDYNEGDSDIYVEQLFDNTSSLVSDSDKDETVNIARSAREHKRKPAIQTYTIKGTATNDADTIDAQCNVLKIRKRKPAGPSLDEQLVLADSYPDYFYFEKFPRSSYFSLVYYGERFHSAVFTEYYTYWSCPQRRKHQCPAQVRVSNDYKRFERRYEHTHPDIKGRQGEAFTPKEALPHLFILCRKMVLRYRTKLRMKLLEKRKASRSSNQTSSQKHNDRPEIKAAQNQDECYDELDEYDVEQIDELFED